MARVRRIIRIKALLPALFLSRHTRKHFPWCSAPLIRRFAQGWTAHRLMGKQSLSNKDSVLRDSFMNQPQTRFVRYLLKGAFYRLSYRAWGKPDLPPLICVHALTRNAHDFDVLARAMSDRFHVICPDLPGRGASDWLPDASLYEPQNYVTALAHLLGGIEQPVSFLGTSLGGLCGMLLASSLGHPIEKLVLNDIGPLIPGRSLSRIRDYMLRARPEFPDMCGLEAYLRQVHAGFGPLTDRQWERLARHSARTLADGRVALHYDPGIARPMRSMLAIDTNLWRVWEKIRVPVMVVRGESSDVLLPDTVERMVRGGATSLEVPGCGHAPALMDRPSIQAIRRFLLGS
ncbi:2-hydroxy-6-oxo-6-phenylhexa-2,4-dienoate hydrolase [Granulibacter bethesdensis]|uniref:2-hydroxy-6-oxo-6-phenylhexa-2,4-dienoate hydrolase n=2 Tax=Granulibacter bethesdensis TaxID=364410 RepID=Q0BTF6_GRABC|nr:2-hydroxy-6-oxo-6-phenylhexa-2,4-dienoate hydrolase [Granulibacter bethesdensis CGDNIH1]AHJ66605.1 2-hydroxy-6-oxo-6-phenylhexa-2,4-dienoate hydrolase [Granulibacter bethesdensis CGDNIH4]AHJ69215.1 2-hydroxy-6-oxo-6-phenylhexa-2,4-dienoate hydrolase [Granulibacter bethesdensis]APH51710.1 2-hydroxy-6-oxo-6-phenylhexa-2,4-dienoate hydrolase [Granulibacter bethesdensis]APH59332.1 2-hydroxy-6-oxo-6-phenylhexa-2,4-dienoate hydrolase [Granulibacter bethesdensis]